MTQLLHPREAALDRFEKALLFSAGDALEVLLLRHELRVDVAHRAGHRPRELRERRLAPAQEPGVAHGSAQDAPQHVAAPFVRRVDAVSEQKRHGARMVGKHPVGRAGGAAVVGPPHDLDRLRDDRLKQIGVEIRGHILHDGGDALEPGPRIDRGFREILPRAVGLQVILHEDEVPDLELLPLLVQADELFGGELPSAALVFGTKVDVQLGVRAGGAGIGHLPEIILVAEAEDSGVRDPGDLAPQLARFIVGMVHRDVQAVRIDAEPLAARHPLPGVLDRFISKKVWCRAVWPTCSRSLCLPPARTHFWQVTARE